MRLFRFLFLVLVAGCSGKDVVESTLSGRCIEILDEAFVYESKCPAISGEHLLSSTTHEVNLSPCLSESYSYTFSQGKVFVVDRIYKQQRGESGFCYRAIVIDLKENKEFDVPACHPAHPRPYWLKISDRKFYFDKELIKLTSCPESLGKIS